MKNVQIAIERACEGGYGKDLGKKFKVFSKDNIWIYLHPDKPSNEEGHWFDGHISDFFLDPQFWQCLGEAEGKDKTVEKLWEAETNGVKIEHSELWWIVKWHSFIDALAEGKSPDQFFANILKP